jgi:hypothetical protein
MKNIQKYLIIGLFVVIGILWFTRPEPTDLKNYIKIGGKEYELLSQKRDTVYKDTTIYKTEYVPKYIKGDTEYIPVPVDVDTTEILKEYFSKVTYKDTIDYETYGNIIINDIISQNKIFSRKPVFNLKLPTITETTTVKELPKNQLYIGGGIGVDKVDILNQAKLGLLWKTKQDKIFGLHIGTTFNGPPEQVTIPFVEGSMYWKIKLGKN